jgi:hypothetical protein
MYRISLAILLCGCTLPLDKSGTASDASSSPDTVAGCALFAGTDLAISVGTSLELPGAATLWAFDGALTPGSRSDGIIARVNVSDGACPGSLSQAAIALPPSATESDFARPLALARAGDDIWLFYETWRFDPSAAFGVKTVGRGVGKFTASSGSFTRGGLLWTADRPAYGQAALVDGGWLYAYGCSGSADGWSRDCYVARVPVASISDGTAWQYATGVGQFTNHVDDAQPILTGVGDLSVHRHASGRLLLTYVKPLDTLLQVRSALGPTGPFSAAHALGQCEASQGTFCVGAVQHPELDPDARTIAVTFARASFDPLPNDVRWPRLAFLLLPDTLP